ncbi:peroxiredoxin [Haliovirga abyssi]|uniref:thioredoxin-dependent peroxiredoxin n=1 Tax=Haliovirga abyssi TaxID=2996794 RepID=A0AAU9DG58_9FUSO|nr:peroxiredoxin [Haliovirga abyssi]BDU51218.1 peroxiredoxin [Haliovirga abyssi]
MGVKVEEEVKKFILPNQDRVEIKLEDYKGKWIVLYFYPKDNTSGCTTEALEFTKLKREFDNELAVIIGVSKDSPRKHKNFIKKHEIGIELLSDENLEVINGYGLWKLKKMYGREYHGTERTTLLIDPHFKIVYKWEKVKPKGHAEKVLEKIREFNR